MSRPSALGVGILGAGRAGRMHARLFARRFPDVRLFIASRDRERAAALASATGAAGHHASYDEALADPRVDVALVTTPPASHLEWTLRALSSGKDVIVEKPAFPRSQDFDLVDAAVRRAGRRVLVAENYFYKPLLARLRSVIEGGELGRVRFVQINAVKRQRSDGWRDDPDLVGGGALLEGGIHWVSFLVNLGLELTDVRASFAGDPPGFERSAVVLADYAQGAVGILTYSWEVPGTLRGLRLSRVWGTDASLLFETNGLFVLRSGRRPRFWAPDPTDIAGYRAMFADFFHALALGGPARFTLDAARRDVELVECAYRSAGVSPPSYPR
jgi:predicted dehydrogenase